MVKIDTNYFERRVFVLIIFAIWAMVAAFFVWWSIIMADGHLVYTLDDPYIHLSVAENILLGGYGVNAEEYSSPSSSIIYPFLLALSLAIGLGQWGPLAINLLAQAVAVWLLLDSLWRRATPEDRHGRFFALCLSVLLLLVINSFGLPITGMEHSLHVLLAIIAIRALAANAESGRVSLMLCCAVILMPLVRFEGLALAAGILLSLALLGKIRAALLLGIVIAGLLAGYAVVMSELGLPVMPSSVLAKSRFAAELEENPGLRNQLGHMATSAYWAIQNRSGAILGLVIAALLFAPRRSGISIWRSPEGAVATASIVALSGHLAVGHYGWFWRYEIYAFAIAASSLIYVHREKLGQIQSQSMWSAQVACLVMALIVAAPHVNATLATPNASRGIYLQQYQMHRFATEYFPHNVAVNDLGWVSYRNSNFVVDLAGLGSDEVRRLRSRREFGSSAIERIIRQHNVRFAMVYDSWVGDVLPPEWCRVAILQTPKVSAAEGEVAFYATSDAYQTPLRRALEAFEPTLPPDDQLIYGDCDIEGSDAKL